MQRILLPLFLMAMVGCQEGDSKSEYVDLSGTWVFESEIDKYDSESDSYISTQYQRFTLILSDTDEGVRYEQCWEYDEDGPFAEKTESSLSIYPADTPFIFQNDNTLQRAREYQYDYAPEYYYQANESIRQVSQDVVIDNGTIALYGPISHVEYAHVCVLEVSSNVDAIRTVSVLTPYGDNYLDFHLVLNGSISPGPYSYEDHSSPSPVRLDVISNANIFWDFLGTNILNTGAGEVTIIQAYPEAISGSFSFVGQDGGNYSGEFEALLSDD